MRYIRINRKSLEVDVVASKGDKAIYVPVRRERSGSAFIDLYITPFASTFSIP